MADNTAALDRLTESVRKVGIGVTEVAGALRAHPAAQDDSGRLNSMADALDSAATTLSGLAATIEAPVADDPAPTPEPTVEPPVPHDPNAGSVETPPQETTTDNGETANDGTVAGPADPAAPPQPDVNPAPAAEDSATDGA